MSKKVLLIIIFMLVLYQCNTTSAITISANETYSITTMKCFDDATVRVVSPGEKKLDYRLYEIGDNCVIIDKINNLWSCVCNDGSDMNLTISMLTNIGKTFNVIVDRYIVPGKNPTYLFSDNFNNIIFIKSTKWNNKWYMSTYNDNVDIAKIVFKFMLVLLIIAAITFLLFSKYRQYKQEQEENSSNNKREEDII